MALTVNTRTYTADSYAANATVYVGPANTVSVVDQLRLARTSPKPTSEFSGVARTQSKLTKTLTLSGALTPTAPIIIEINASVPVGAAAADVDVAATDVGSFTSSTAFKNLLKTMLINN